MAMIRIVPLRPIIWLQLAYLLLSNSLINEYIAYAAQDKSDEFDERRFDDFARHLMAHANAPGVQLAVAKGAQLKYFKAFGLANTHTQQPLTTSSVMRYYSVSKTITGTAILKLVQEGRLRLDDRPFAMLKDLAPPKNANVDARLLNVTVQNLLQHTGGWNVSAIGYVDAIFMPSTLVASNALGTQVPATTHDQIRFTKGLPLNFEPGTAFAYSNIGYSVLGKLIEKVTGMPYEDYIQKHVFDVAGLEKGHIVSAHSRVEDLEPNEVRYYGVQGEDPLIVSVFPGEGYVPSSYGLFDISQVVAAGGWVGSAGDLLKYMVHIDGLRSPALLKPQMVYSMIHAPRPPINLYPIPSNLQGELMSFGLQWIVGDVATKNGTFTAVFPKGESLTDSNNTVTFFGHPGGAPGAHSLCIRLIKEEISMAYLLNSSPNDTSFVPSAIVNFTNLATPIQKWPHHDLF